MNPATIRAEVWSHFQMLPPAERPNVIAELLTFDEAECLRRYGIRPTNEWFAAQAARETHEERIVRLERIVNVLRKAAKGDE